MEKKMDILLHKLYHLMVAYWYGAKDVEDGTVIISDYEDWKTGILLDGYNEESLTDAIKNYIEMLSKGV